MRVVWASVRDLNRDLCATTQRCLAAGLAKHGHDVTFLGPGMNPEAIEGVEHLTLNIRARKGRRSRAIADAIIAQWPDLQTPDIVLVEWPLAKRMLRSGVLDGIPWMLVDRSPPADAGLLARLHGFVWRRAWRMARKASRGEEGPVGTVVSPAHARHVQAFTKLNHDQIVVLPAGVNLRRFIPGAERRSTERTLHLVYHGRLDRNRGVLLLPMLHQKAVNAGLEVTLTLIGERDALPALTKMAKATDDIHVLGRLPQDEVAHRLGTSHLGLLPMPEHRAWSLASPLKRSEYLASGMMVIGLDHEGHRLPEDVPFMHLFAKEDLHDGAIALLKQMAKDPSMYPDGKRAARHYAEAHLGWEHSVLALHEALEQRAAAKVPTTKAVPGMEGDLSEAPVALEAPEAGPLLAAPVAEPAVKPEVKQTPEVERAPKAVPEAKPEVMVKPAPEVEAATARTDEPEPHVRRKI